jgi:hypothetical protein
MQRSPYRDADLSWLKDSSLFMEANVSEPCLQEHATGPYLSQQ